MLAHSEVVDRFFQGKESGKGSRMKIVPIDEDTTVLEGYGWAAYAMNHKGRIYKFNGWIGFSVTTTQHMIMINPPKDIDYYVYGDPTTRTIMFNRERYTDVPEDKYGRLESRILKPSDRFEFPKLNLIIKPRTELVVKDTETGWQTHIPNYEKAAEAILDNDQKSLEFMKRLANSTLDPRNHMHFSHRRLEEAMNISEKVTEAIDRYLSVVDKSLSKKFTPFNLGGYIIFARKNTGSIDVLSTYNTLNGIACYKGKRVNKVAMGKVLYNKKVHSSIKKKLFKKEITPSSLAEELARHGMTGTIDNLPKWISTEVIAHQLGVA